MNVAATRRRALDGAAAASCRSSSCDWCACFGPSAAVPGSRTAVQLSDTDAAIAAARQSCAALAQGASHRFVFGPQCASADHGHGDLAQPTVVLCDRCAGRLATASPVEGDATVGWRCATFATGSEASPTVNTLLVNVDGDTLASVVDASLADQPLPDLACLLLEDADAVTPGDVAALAKAHGARLQELSLATYGFEVPTGAALWPVGEAHRFASLTRLALELHSPLEPSALRGLAESSPSLSELALTLHAGCCDARATVTAALAESLPRLAALRALVWDEQTRGSVGIALTPTALAETVSAVALERVEVPRGFTEEHAVALAGGRTAQSLVAAVIGGADVSDGAIVGLLTGCRSLSALAVDSAPAASSRFFSRLRSSPLPVLETLCLGDFSWGDDDAVDVLDEWPALRTVVVNEGSFGTVPPATREFITSGGKRKDGPWRGFVTSSGLKAVM